MCVCLSSQMSKSALVDLQRHVDRCHHQAQAAMISILTCEGDVLLLLGLLQKDKIRPPLSLERVFSSWEIAL